MPHKSSVPLYWRLQKSRYTLTGTRCATCDGSYFPPKSFCPGCRRKGDIREFRFSGRGKVVSHTTIRIPPEGFERCTPYAVAMVELEEGPRISAQVIGDPEEVRIGQQVRPVFRRLHEDGCSGLIQYGLKFEAMDGTKDKLSADSKGRR